MPNRVTCKICGKQYKTLYAHLRTHSITSEEYEEQHGGPLTIASVLEACSKMNPEAKAKRKASVTASNKRRWREDREKEIKNLDHARDARTHVERARKQWHSGHKERIVKAVSASNRKRWRDDYELELKRSRSHVREKYKGVTFRSRWEVVVAKCFDQAGILWVYEPETFQLATVKYTPDFYLPEFDHWVEVKAHYHYDELDQTRTKEFRETGRELTLLLDEGYKVLRTLLK